jgi:hypothetical protein
MVQFAFALTAQIWTVSLQASLLAQGGTGARRFVLARERRIPIEPDPLPFKSGRST